jgi:dipeptidase E
VKREQDFHGMVKKQGGMGIAIDNNCAIEFIGDEYRVITSRPAAGAYRVYRRGGKIVRETVEQRQGMTPTLELLQRPGE